MTADVAIEAAGLGKRYLLGEDTSRERLLPLWPFGGRRNSAEFWALRNVSFTVHRGEAVGVIGRNGAGKSTLLKILSRVTGPTEGRARVVGRVGTLLEIGTGFHPDLTGRDNIYLSGTILGMTHRQVAAQFDEIVAFAGIDQFIDTPVRRYSSGMYVRLAFSVAASLQPQILIVDEVLAVGDAAFQRRCLDRLDSAAQDEGRTVLFVSHNLQAIRKFCSRVIVLARGEITFDGPTEQGIAHYLKSLQVEDLRDTGLKDRLNRTTGAVRFTRARALASDGTETWRFKSGETVRLRFDYEVVSEVPSLVFGLYLRSPFDQQVITTFREVLSGASLPPGRSGKFELELPSIPLRAGEFALYAFFSNADDTAYYDVIDANVDLPFLVLTPNEREQPYRLGFVSLEHRLRVLEPVLDPALP